MRFRRHANAAVASFFAEFRRPERTAVGLGVRKRHERKLGVVRMDAARRRLVENLDRRVGASGGESPVVPGAESAARPGEVKSYDYTILEQHRRPARWHRDGPV